jgi:cytochrome c oxidase subunit 4
MSTDTSDATATPHRARATVRTYLAIGVVLAILTAIEVQVPNWLAHDRPLLITTLLIVAVVKAGFVALYYMHLKFDSPIYSGIVLLALVLLAYFLWLLIY